MKKENLTPEKIQEFNNKVEYNESAASWMIDIVATLIAWPMIILAIRRRATTVSTTGPKQRAAAVTSSRPETTTLCMTERILKIKTVM